MLCPPFTIESGKELPFLVRHTTITRNPQNKSMMRIEIIIIMSTETAGGDRGIVGVALGVPIESIL